MLSQEWLVDSGVRPTAVQSVVDQTASDATAGVQDLATRLGLHPGSEATLADPLDLAHAFWIVDRHRCTPSPKWGKDENSRYRDSGQVCPSLACRAARIECLEKSGLLPRIWWPNGSGVA